MNRLLLFVFALFLAISITYAVTQVGYGYGYKITVTATPTQVTFLTGVSTCYVRTVSVYNSGTDDVFCAINCSTGTFSTLLGTTNAIGIPGNMVFTFTKIPPERVNSLCIGTLGPTSIVYVSAY